MTTFRSRIVRPEDVSYQAVSNSDPDAIGIEVITRAGGEVFDVMKERDGRCSICFGRPVGASGWEIEIEDFRNMLAKALTDIDDWDANLRTADGPWPMKGAS